MIANELRNREKGEKKENERRRYVVCKGVGIGVGMSDRKWKCLTSNQMVTSKRGMVNRVEVIATLPNNYWNFRDMRENPFLVIPSWICDSRAWKKDQGIGKGLTSICFLRRST